MLVRFIAHAGFSVEMEEQQVLIDPWFTDSVVSSPIIQSVVGHNTIDFQVPKTKEVIGDYSPNAIFLSHFHGHHASHDDLMVLASQTKEMTLGFPDLREKNKVVRDTFATWPHVTVSPFNDGDILRKGPFKVTGLLHALDDHMAWLVESDQGRLLHIADPIINHNEMDRSLGGEWKQFEELRPDLLCINAGGNTLRKTRNGKRYFVENAAVSPVEAARIVEIIKPKAVCLIGCYNWSVWRNRLEYIRPAPFIEDEFYWALSWLVPEVRFLSLKPGQLIGLQDRTLLDRVDHFIS